MGLGVVTYGSNNIQKGLYVDKPANPKAGDMYVCTDTGYLLKSLVDGSWDNNRLAGFTYSDSPDNLYIYPRAVGPYPNVNIGISSVVGIFDPNLANISIQPGQIIMDRCTTYFKGDVYRVIDGANKLCYHEGNFEIVGIANTTKTAFQDLANLGLSSTLTVKKSTTVPADIRKANVRISWDIGYDGSGRDMESLLKINGVQVGTTRITENNWTTYTEDVTVYAGDLIEIWARYTDTLNPGGNIRNFKVLSELKQRVIPKTAGTWIMDVEQV